jgi:hypothetical protein
MQAILPVRGRLPARTLFTMEEHEQPEELAHRADDGMNVKLLWSRTDKRLAVEVSDFRSCRRFRLEAPPDRALDVFYHPFAYTSSLGGR